MNWIEIISLRSSEKIREPLISELMNPIAYDDKTSGLLMVKIYRNASIDTHVSIHLHWKSARARQDGSVIGLHLAQALKEFGLVDHSFWVEEMRVK